MNYQKKRVGRPPKQDKVVNVEAVVTISKDLEKTVKENEKSSTNKKRSNSKKRKPNGEQE